MKKSFSKSIAILIIIALNYAGLSAIGKTMASFSDMETIAGNTFTAGTLNISLDNVDTYSSGLMYPSDATTTTISLSNIGSLDSQYTASTTVSGGDTTACDYVTMTATTPTFSYTGSIKNFISPATTTLATTWNFIFTVANDAPASVWGKTCSFKWSYTAWQDNVPNSSSGFTAIKEKLGAIRIGKAVVLNEILPNPNSGDKEFIELYNNGNVSIDLAGWKVSEWSFSGGIPTSENKYVISSTVGTGLATSQSGTTIILPKHWIVLHMSGNILNNDGDIVSFYDIYDTLIDDYSYDVATHCALAETPGSTNGLIIPPIDCNKSTIPAGKSIARIPDGVGDWVDPIPTPGEPNELDTSDIVPQNLNIGLVDDSFGPVIVADDADSVVVNAEPEQQAETAVETSATDIPEEIPATDEESMGNESSMQADEGDVLDDETIPSEERLVLKTEKDAVPIVVPTNEEIAENPELVQSDENTVVGETKKIEDAPVLEIQEEITSAE